MNTQRIWLLWCTLGYKYTSPKSGPFPAAFARFEDAIANCLRCVGLNKDNSFNCRITEGAPLGPVPIMLEEPKCFVAARLITDTYTREDDVLWYNKCQLSILAGGGTIVWSSHRIAQMMCESCNGSSLGVPCKHPESSRVGRLVPALPRQTHISGKLRVFVLPCHYVEAHVALPQRIGLNAYPTQDQVQWLCGKCLRGPAKENTALRTAPCDKSKCMYPELMGDPVAMFVDKE